MKAKRRKSIEVDKVLIFSSDKETFEYYWDYKYINIKNEGKIWIDYNYAETELPSKVIISLVYLDSNRTFHPSEQLEYIVKHEIPIPKPNFVGKSEIIKDFKIIDNSKLLWKICFQIKTKNKKTLLHYSLTN